MKRHAGSQRGSALVGVLMATALISVVAGLLLMQVTNASRVAGRRASTIVAFQAAEAGLEAGKLAFERTNTLLGIPTTFGVLPEATFEVRPGVGNFGTESWAQWGFDPRASRFNPTAAVGDQPRIGWRTQFSPAKNGNVSGGTFFGNNLFAVVASGMAYVSYENPSNGRIEVAAFSAMDGSVLWTTAPGNLLGRGLAMSAMATIEEGNILLFTYLSQNDPNGTVRLMALDVNQTNVQVRWNFDTGIHGLGSPPAIYNPNPNVAGEEIIYFTVAEAPDWQVTDVNAGRTYPETAAMRAESLRVFAVRDGGMGNPVAKWEHPYPDPDVGGWTDYPTERWTVASGVIDRPEDVGSRPPDEDLLVDYYNSNGGMQTTVVGDLYMIFDPQSFSPPVLQVEDNGTPANSSDDHIHLYVYYTAITDKDRPGSDFVQSTNTPPAANSEQIHWQAELVALLDRPGARFPEFEFTYNPPDFDPDRTDGIAWNGYGEENWESFFEQTAAPMITRQVADPNGTLYAAPRTVVYMPYESLEWATAWAYDNNTSGERSRAMLMGVVDRYDDFTAGLSTVTHDEYWVNAQGPDPYVWEEDDIVTVGDLPNGAYPSATRSRDIDIEGESLAYDSTSNVLYFVFNHDLHPGSTNLEQLRIHAINARTGQGRGVSGAVATHLWDYNRPAVFNGELFNATPALAGNLVYIMYRSPAGGGRTAELVILHSNDGTPTPTSPLTIDTDCDGADIAPSVANDAIYVGTYDDIDKVQRVFALSPSIWLLSTGTSNDGRARRTLALRQQNSALVEWREGGFAGGPL